MIIVLAEGSLEEWMIINTMSHLEACGYDHPTPQDAIRFLYEVVDDANPER